MNELSEQRDDGGRHDSIEEEAAAWFGRCEIALSPEQARVFMRWLEADPRHAEAMREMDETWDILDGLKQIRRRGQAAGPAFLRWPGSKRRLPALLLAAAAAMVIAAVGFWSLRVGEPRVQQVATEMGGMKKMDLPDGSVVHLNANSEVKVNFSGGERRVQLTRGEAHFTVAKDRARPFVVVAGAVAVNAVGTAFNVRYETKGVAVFVTEGVVRLDDSTGRQSRLPAAPPSPALLTPGVAEVDRPEPITSPESSAPTLLAAGEHAFIASPERLLTPTVVVRKIAPEEIQQALAWQARQLDFDLTPLAEVVAEFNQHNTHQLQIADPELGQQTFGGSFRADNYDVFVQLLEQRFGVVAERMPGRTILRRVR